LGQLRDNRRILAREVRRQHAAVDVVALQRTRRSNRRVSKAGRTQMKLKSMNSFVPH